MQDHQKNHQIEVIRLVERHSMDSGPERQQKEWVLNHQKNHLSLLVGGQVRYHQMEGVQIHYQVVCCVLRMNLIKYVNF